MHPWKRIHIFDFDRLDNKSGFYKIDSNLPDYYKDGKLHNEFGAARLWGSGKKQYCLNDIYYGSNISGDPKHYIPNDEYWIKYQKLLVFK